MNCNVISNSGCIKRAGKSPALPVDGGEHISLRVAEDFFPGGMKASGLRCRQHNSGITAIAPWTAQPLMMMVVINNLYVLSIPA